MAYPDVLVIGAGVSGLTTAISLADTGRTVRIVTQLPPRKTNSAMAGASWGPYRVDDPRVLHWSNVTRRVFQELAADPASGVRLVNGVEAADHVTEPPAWAVDVPDFRVCRDDELARLPSRYVSAWRYTIPLIDMPVYLDYLTEHADRAGVKVEAATVSSFREVAGAAGAVINCTGLGARRLVPDPLLFPTRGQLVVMENPGIEEFFQDDTHGDDLTYVLPHGRHVVLGGCAADHSEDPKPVTQIAKAIVERCVEIEPRLTDARLIENRVGFRPSRGQVRTERVELGGVPLIHNYGHGGAGVTLSWGCAQEVLQLLDRAPRDPPRRRRGPAVLPPGGVHIEGQAR